MPSREKKRPSVTPDLQQRDRDRPPGRARGSRRRACRTAPCRAPPGPGRGGRPRARRRRRRASLQLARSGRPGVKPGSSAAVELDARSRSGSTFILLAAADDRRVDGVAEHRLERRAALAEQAQRRVGQARLQQRPQHSRLRAAAARRPSLDHLAHDGRHVHRQCACGRGRASSVPSRAIAPPRSASRRGRRARAPSPSASRSASRRPGSDRSACRRRRA